MAYYNIPTTGATTREDALREFARRNTPEGGYRVKLTQRELENMKSRLNLEGVCYQSGHGVEVYLNWDEMTEADMALITQ